MTMCSPFPPSSGLLPPLNLTTCPSQTPLPALRPRTSYLSPFYLFSVPSVLLALAFPKKSPTSRPSSTAGSPRRAPTTPARDHLFFGGSFRSSYITFVPSSPVPLSRCPSYKYTCTHSSPTPTSWAFQKPSLSPASSAKVRLKLTASGSLMLSTTPSQPSQPHGDAVGFLSRTKRTPLSNLGWEEGGVWVGPVQKTGLGREGREGERPERKCSAPTT